MTFGLPVAVALFGWGCSNENQLERHKEAPQVSITTPGLGATFRQDNGELAFTAVVSDSYDAPSELVVTLHADGELLPLQAAADGTVETTLPLAGVPVGSLLLLIEVKDSDGMTAQASVTVAIGGPLGAPDVRILTPDSGATFLVGDTVPFRGTATDLTTAPDDLVFSWSSDLAGPIAGAVSGDGSSALITDALPVGVQVVTLTATDSDGEVGSDSVTVTIADTVVEDTGDSGGDTGGDTGIVVEADAGDLLFSEMMVDPEAVDDEVGEWVELYNTSNHPIDVGGYTFRDDDIDSWVLEGPLVVAAHDYLVLCANVDSAANGGVPCDGGFNRDWNGGGVALANGADELVLTRPDGLEIDWLYYDGDWYTKAVARGVDTSALEAGDNDAASSWCDQTTVLTSMEEPGTPGLANDDCSGL